MTPDQTKKLHPLSWLIFSSRWMQLPLYLGLIVAQGVYVILFVKELIHLIHGATSLSEQLIMLAVLGLIDVVMISNLLVMVIVGGYETFVSRLNLQGHPIVVGQTQAGASYTQAGVMWQTIIHCVFILSAIGIAWTDSLMSQAAKANKASH